MNRLEVLKTYKIFIGGQFPRTESGRYFIAKNAKGQQLANMCLSSRKDVRDAVSAARSAFGGWYGRTAYNRSQILYRIAEMLESRKAQFINELQLQGSTAKQAETEVCLSIDRLIYYAGWCDKFQQVLSAVNPVASSHFNFSVPEAMGVIGILTEQNSSLLGLVSIIAPAIAGGNTCVVLASELKPLCAITFAEVLATSDLPGGVVNILTGQEQELVKQFAEHKDINAVIYNGTDIKHLHLIQEKSIVNLKRVINYMNKNWFNEDEQDVYFIQDTQEIKTTWHPIENIGGSKAGY